MPGQGFEAILRAGQHAMSSSDASPLSTRRIPMPTDDIDRSHHDDPHSPPGPHVVELQPDDPHCLWDEEERKANDRHDYSGCPPPPIPAAANLRHFDWFPLYFRDLRESDLWADNLDAPEIIVAALALWMAAMHQVPVGSLPDNANKLMSLADIHALTQRRHQFEVLDAMGMQGAKDALDSLPEAKLVLDLALHGFQAYSDGRLYHPYLTKVITKSLTVSEKQSEGGKRTQEILKQKRELKTEKKNARAKLGAKLKVSSSSPSDMDTDIDKDKEERSPLTPASGGTRAAPSASQERKQAPPSAAERGSARTQFADRHSSPPEASPRGESKNIDPEASATRRETLDNSKLKAEFGFTSTEMVDALHQACFGSNRLIGNSPKLESAEAVITLMRDNPAVSFTLDVLPAIKARVSRAGDKIGSWAFFRDAILGWSQNRVSGAGNGQQVAQGPYDPANLPRWWMDWDKGEPPPGHPWQKRVIDERTRELRRNGGHWDWKWFDRVEKYKRTGEWDYSFHEKLPGRPGSSCPDDILAQFGIEPQVMQMGTPIIDMRVARDVAARRAREGHSVPFPPPLAPEGGTLAKAMGGLATGVAGHSPPDDDAPPL
jgi:hypothetical protein